MTDVWMVCTVELETTVMHKIHGIFSTRAQAEKACNLIKCPIDMRVIKVKWTVFRSWEGFVAYNNEKAKADAKFGKEGII